jgi:hypothetical protein
MNGRSTHRAFAVRFGLTKLMRSSVQGTCPKDRFSAGAALR